MGAKGGEIRIAKEYGSPGRTTKRASALRGNRGLRPRRSHSLFKRAKPIAAIALGVWLLSVLVFRFASPPVTTLVVIRQIQSWFSSHTGLRDWRCIGSREVPQYVLQAVVTAEDARFLEHWGVDLLAVGDVLDSAGGKRRLRGASTITMQTVKNIYLWPGRSYVRKALEWLMAPLAGAMWGKRRTLELYINVIEWGDGIYGIESAARHYYHKSASKLSPQEAAALAAILPNPRRLSPLAMVQSTRRRYARILREMHMTEVPR
jgi:monofunctional biosynthetic peptidoglycan transglycosylase